MRLFELARHPTRPIRLAILALTLTFGLNALAHAAHSHSASATEIAACGSCLTFTGMADAPRHALPVFVPAKHETSAATFASAPLAVPLRTQAQPRAPPVR